MSEPTKQNNPDLLSRFSPEQLKAALDLKQSQEVKGTAEVQSKPVAHGEKSMEEIRNTAEKIQGNAFANDAKAESSINQSRIATREVDKDNIISEALHNGQLLKKDGTPSENLNELLNLIQ